MIFTVSCVPVSSRINLFRLGAVSPGVRSLSFLAVGVLPGVIFFSGLGAVDVFLRGARCLPVFFSRSADNASSFEESSFSQFLSLFNIVSRCSFRPELYR